MPAAPDFTTLSLCSSLSSTAFALVFTIIWFGRPRDRYLLHWAASGLCYVTSLVGLELLPWHPTGVPRVALIALIPLSDLLILSGARAFHHRRPFRPWMALPVLLIVVGWFIAHDAASFAPPGHLRLLAQESVLIILAGTIVVTGAPLVARRPWRLLGGARMAGAALLAYLPVYSATFVVDHLGLPWGALADALPLMADQLLLPILNLGLLWMPSERATQELRDGALRDPLTGVWNRRWLERHRADLTEPGSAVILIDIDHFKAINDRHGHAAGDALLLGFAARAHALLDERDGFIVRLGGDEFLVIVPEVDRAEARQVAEDLRLSLASDDPMTPGTSASIGVAILARGVSLSDTMAEADRALYRAKAAGRNQVTLDVDMPA